MILFNYLGILVAAVAAFVVGALWYGPFFGKQWRALMFPAGMPQGKFTMVQAMIGGFIATVVMIFVLAIFLGALSVGTLTSTVLVAFWIWLGFIATTMLNAVFYESRPWKLYFINASHYLVALIIASLVLYYWQW